MLHVIACARRGRQLKGIDKAEKFKEPILNAIDKMLDNGEISDEMARKILSKNKTKKAVDLVDEIERQFDTIFNL